MRFLIVCIIFVLNLQVVLADLVRTSPFYNRQQVYLKNPLNQRNKYYLPRRDYRINNFNNKIYNQHCPRCYSDNFYHRPIKINNLKKLEKYAMNKTFSGEDDNARLERLEQLAFGATQSGTFQTRYDNLETAILSRPSYKSKSSIISKIGGFLAGQPTGFTPNITTQELNGFNNFNSFGGNHFGNVIRPYQNYNNNMVEQYSNGIFSGGWTNLGNDFGNGSSIRILP